MLTIRRASEADVDALVPLKAAVHVLHVAHRPDYFKAMTDDALAAWLLDRLAEDTTDVWLAERDAEPLGYAIAIRRDREEAPYAFERAWYEIDEIAVADHARRQGVARALIEHAVAHAQSAGLATVELTTWSFNDTAHTAFTRSGFEPMRLRYERPAHAR
jgi:GNAT superfamily N-acetyltransferase